MAGWPATERGRVDLHDPDDLENVGQWLGRDALARNVGKDYSSLLSWAFLGTGNLLGQLLGVGSSALVLAILTGVSYPYSFALCFAHTAISVWVSYGFISPTYEPARPAAAHSQRLSREYGRRLLAYLGGMATGFIAVYAVEQFNLPDSVAAIFTGVLYVANVAGWRMWGTG